MTQWKLVPVEPTDEMAHAFTESIQFWMEENGEDKDVYQSMLAAAPKASEDEELVETVALMLARWDMEYYPVTNQNKARAILKMLENSK